MFFRRGRLRAGQARSWLLDLFNHQYQWWLRTPIRNLLARDDRVCFLCSLALMVDHIGQGLYLLNQRKPPASFDRDGVPPWFGPDLGEAITDFSLVPDHLAERLREILTLDDPVLSEVEGRRLMIELMGLFLSQGRKKEETPLPWLDGISPPEVEELVALEPDSSQTMNLARRAVRIVWRLPGGWMTALTGSGAAGMADQSSDVDIVVYSDQLADEAVRRSLVGATSDGHQDATHLTQKRYARDVFWLDGRMIDVRYYLLEDLKRLVEHPIPHSRLEKEMLAQLDNLNALYDPTLVMLNVLDPPDIRRAFQGVRAERLNAETSRLDEALARLSGSSEHGPARLHATVEVILALFDLLAARNDRWIAFPRWTAAWLERLDAAPPDAQERLMGVAATPFRHETTVAKAATLRALASEVRAL